MKIEISEDKSTATIDGVEYNLKRKGKKISEWLQELPLPNPKFEVWKPRVGNWVYYIDKNGFVDEDYFDKNSKLPYLMFKTESEALEAHKKAMFNYEVEMFIKEKNEGWVPDFIKGELSDVYYICEIYNNNEVGVHKEQNLYVRHTSKNKLFKSWEIGEEIIAKFDNEKLIKWWI